MWTCPLTTIPGSAKVKPENLNPNFECSDDDASYDTSREEGLECPICRDSFNLVENVPYVLSCGHTLCKHCLLALPWATLKFPTLVIQLPCLIACPWCNFLCPRVTYKGVMRFPKKNYFILWMVESMNGERARSYTSSRGEARETALLSANSGMASQTAVRNHGEISRSRERSEPGYYVNLVRLHLNRDGLRMSLRKSLDFIVHLTAKFPLIVIFLLVILYAVPASAAILVLYILITVLFALPSFLVIYFAYPCLDWLIREILT